MIVWIEFLLCTAVILFSGTKLTKYGDVLAEKTGLGRTWIGVVLIASVTSLPELITGISSVTIYDIPNIAAGDVLGSCMFNILIIALMDFKRKSPPISANAHQGQVLTAAFGMLLLGLISLSITVSSKMPAVGWIGVSSIAFVAVYFVAMRLVFLYEKKRVAEFFSEFAADTLYAGMSKRTASIMYGLNAVVIIIAATYLPGLGEQIADTTGLGRTFVGTAFVSVSTSLPELVVAAAAMRIGAVDMVFGNVLGSNLFNTVILAVDDFLYTKGPLLAKVSYTHSITANAAVAMTAIAVIGLTYRTNRKLVFFAWHSLGIIILYGFATCLLFVLR